MIDRESEYLPLKKISNFFDQLALSRDMEFDNNHILGYEQRMRQYQLARLIEPSGGSLLDAGCGNGRDTEILLTFSEANNYIGIDLSKEMLAKAREKHQGKRAVMFREGSLTELDFPDCSFRQVVCSEVLEHIPNWKNAVVEMARVLEPGGVMIVSTPNTWSLYYPQKKYLEKKNKTHPYDSWKNYCILKKVLVSVRLKVVTVRGACYLPGQICYIPSVHSIIAPFLPLLEKVERNYLSNFLTRYFGYMIFIKLIKTN